jgi:thiopurine S-methyltransferase
MSVMEPTFWEDRWAAGQIGFHQGHPHPLLTEHVDRLDGRKRVLVPLCGKATDMRYLADRGHEVVGIELVRAAIEAFFEEQQIVATAVRTGPYEGLTGGGITLYAGDFFLSSKEALGSFDALYDRAALVALEPSMRDAYVAHCFSLLDSKARILLITVDFDQSRLEGPPFPADDAAVRALYAKHTVELLKDVIDTPGPRFEAAGINDAHERIYSIA